MLWRASKSIVTPFTGFFLSDFYLSKEIGKLKYEWLNPRSLVLTKRSILDSKPGAILFVQVDQLSEFASEVLPSLRAPFVLITGKESLPGLQDSPEVRQILEHPLLIVWFSQNQILSELPIEYFPYGVGLFRAPIILSKSGKIEPIENREFGPFIPHFSIHDHLSGQARADRERILPRMNRRLPFENYLQKIAGTGFTYAFQGDRPDTYRLWEVLAMGGVPVTNIPRAWETVFKNSVIFEDQLEQFSDHTEMLDYVRPNIEITTVRYWRAKVEERILSWRK